MRHWCALVLIASMTIAAGDAFTHPLPDSTISLDVGREQVRADVRLPVAQLEIGFGKPLPRSGEALTAPVRRDIARYVAAHLTASDRDGSVWCTEVHDVRLVTEPGERGDRVPHVYVTAVLIPPSRATPRNFVLRSDLLVHELLTHRLFVYLRRDWKVKAASVEPFLLGRMTYRTSDLAIDLFESSD